MHRDVPIEWSASFCHAFVVQGLELVPRSNKLLWKFLRRESPDVLGVGRGERLLHSLCHRHTALNQAHGDFEHVFLASLRQALSYLPI